MHFSLHADCWSELFVPDQVENFRFWAAKHATTLRNIRPGRPRSKLYLETSYNFIEKEIDMVRKAKGNGSVRGHSTDNAGSVRRAGGCKWVNVKLSDEDLLNLERSEATLEYIAGCLLGLVDSGFNVSVKVVDEGDSVMACIIRPADNNNVSDVGVSAFSGNARDAALSVLYKFENILGGILTETLVSDTAQRSRFR